MRRQEAGRVFQSHSGYCNVTGYGAGHMCRSSDVQGHWPGIRTLQACLQACLECQRCHYVSWAVGDCSYFRSCAALTAGLQSHKTVRVRGEDGRILVPMPTPTTTPSAAARHDGPDGAALAAGCYDVFVDVGANIGLHARYLFEPQHYPLSQYVTAFGRLLGPPHKRNLSEVCAFAVEPNPAHAQRLHKLETAYQNRGWRLHYLPFGASDRAGQMTFYANAKVRNGKHNHEWGFGTVDREARLKAGGLQRPLSVPTFNLAAFLGGIAARRLPRYASTVRPPRLIVKMDVEGLEYGLLPSLLLRGTLCGGGIDFISVEPHPHFAPTPRLTGGSPLLSSERDAKVVFKYLQEVVADAAGCAELSELDDEAYTHDPALLPGAGSGRESGRRRFGGKETIE